MFIVVSIVTVILIAGSAILQRIVFKADVAESTVYFQQSTPVVKPGSTVELRVVSDVTNAASIAGAQFAVSFDPDRVSFTDIVDAANWQTISTRKQTSTIAWVMVPASANLVESNGASTVSFATLRFFAQSEGSAVFSYEPSETIIAISSPPSSRSLANAVTNVQSGQVSINDLAVPSPAPTEEAIAENSSSQEIQGGFTSQRVIATEPLLGSAAALLLVRTQHPSKIAVGFGPTTDLGLLAENAVVASEAAIRLSGLEPGKRYYYQISAVTPDGSSRSLSQTKSFVLPQEVASASSIASARFEVFPSTFDTSTTAYAAFYDQEGRVISGLNPVVSSKSGNLTIGGIGELSGLYQAPVTASERGKTVIRLSLTANEKEYAARSVLFDPNPENRITTADFGFPVLASNQKTTFLILGLLLALFVFGVGFLRVARAK